jgi:transcriptional regulator with XRE-family HTH domain
MNIEEKIKTLAKEKGLKMEFIIKATAMSNGGFYKMLRNETYTVNVLQKIADTLGIPITDFFPKTLEDLQINSIPKDKYIAEFYEEIHPEIKKSLETCDSQFQLSQVHINTKFEVLLFFTKTYAAYRHRANNIIEKGRTLKSYTKQDMINDFLYLNEAIQDVSEEHLNY